MVKIELPFKLDAVQGASSVSYICEAECEHPELTLGKFRNLEATEWCCCPLSTLLQWTAQ